MKFLNLRKYIFTNLIAIWFYYFVIITTFTWIVLHDKGTTAPNTVIFFYTLIMIISFLVLGVFFILSFLEYLIRKYLIEKKFPNFKLNIKIKIPKLIIAIYNVIFSIGFISTCVLFLAAVIFHVYRI
mgnify:CR=1 FL=1